MAGGNRPNCAPRCWRSVCQMFGLLPLRARCAVAAGACELPHTRAYPCGRLAIEKTRRTRSNKDGNHTMLEVAGTHMPAVRICRERDLKFLATPNGVFFGSGVCTKMKNMGVVHPGAPLFLSLSPCVAQLPSAVLVVYRNA